MRGNLYQHINKYIYITIIYHSIPSLKFDKNGPKFDKTNLKHNYKQLNSYTGRSKSYVGLYKNERYAQVVDDGEYLIYHIIMF